MKNLNEFKTLTDTEEFLEFFDVDYDEHLLEVKRTHIMREFGKELQKINALNLDENKILDFYKFALIKVYKSFEDGYSPSAVEIWDRVGVVSPCSSCGTESTCSTEGAENVQFERCTTEIRF